MDSLKNLSAIVTGGASGMGAETARALIEKGAKVALIDQNLDAAKKLAEQIGALAIGCNVVDAKDAETAIHAAEEVNGPLRICVNCAGIAPAKKIVGKDGVMPLTDFTKVIDVNLIGTFNILRLAASAMAVHGAVNEEGERGVIINTASVAAYEGQIGQIAYSASKAGIVGMTLPAARELARFGIRVMTIAPGIMATPMVASMPSEVQKSLESSIPFPSKFGSAKDFAKLVLHIIENKYLNGEVIRLDGAVRMQPK